MSKLKKICLIVFSVMFVIIGTHALSLLLKSGNLNDFIIDNLSEEQIAKTDGYKATLSKRKAFGEESGLNSMRYEEEDRDYISFSSKKITGIKIVSATLVKDCTLCLNIKSELLSGNAKIVVVIDDSEILWYDFNQDLNLEFEVTGEHKYFVKILCEKAELSIETQRSYR